MARRSKYSRRWRKRTPGDQDTGPATQELSSELTDQIYRLVAEAGAGIEFGRRALYVYTSCAADAHGWAENPFSARRVRERIPARAVDFRTSSHAGVRYRCVHFRCCCTRSSRLVNNRLERGVYFPFRGGVNRVRDFYFESG